MGGKALIIIFFARQVTLWYFPFHLPPSLRIISRQAEVGKHTFGEAQAAARRIFMISVIRHNVAPLTGPPKSQARPPISPLNLIPNLSKPLSILPLFLTGPLGPCPTAGHLDSCKSRPVCSLPEQARSRMYLSIRFLYLLLLIFSSISDPNSNYAESPRSGIRKL